MRQLFVDGKKYDVLENLGYQAGHYAKIVKTAEGEKTVVKEFGVWRFWGIKDRLKPGGQATGQNNSKHKSNRGEK